jgi:anti-sigma regulatory factor (Ser/Thr protein kinase)
MRITQEALSNIRKHAKARNVRILFSAEPQCQLLIEDDGVGFKKDSENFVPRASVIQPTITYNHFLDILKSILLFNSK